ncbi:YdcF family protein [Streptomyces sp. H39-S7]|uniref:YdcF family protein n=1 Tax=Streptomyces sp. H39-S7 TaxID=3004357 RepID=UPI0022AEDF7C|nr:YdcF family protein [Streptomyces sp. H39-S7]MCZ4121009.1 YdcF family protein [Streptomyces sp. H39-S7]
MLPFAYAAYAASALAFLAFAVSFREDRRLFRNAVFLGLGLVLFSVAFVMSLHGAPIPGSRYVLYLLPALVLLAGLALPFALVANGLLMLRKEGRGLGNLLSLLAGLGIFLLLAFLIFAASSGSRVIFSAGVLTLCVVAYVSFLFVCYLTYSFLYGRITVRSGVDFVVVLGCGLVGDQVPPLLVSRLERGRAAYEAEGRHGGTPRLLVSGGQGPDEGRPESHAMAEYLVAKGIPEERILREERSRTTEENLTCSKALMAEHDPTYRCVVVTNNFHAFRAALMARRAGINGQVIGSPTAAYFWPSATIREFVAIFVDHLKLNLAICGGLIALGLAALVAT